jgi:hypothetical protein
MDLHRSGGAAEVHEGPRNRAAYARMLPLFGSVPPVVPRVSVLEASLTVLGALPAIRAEREALGRLPDLDLSEIDGLEDRARAARHAQVLFDAARRGPRARNELRASLIAHLELLRLEARAAALRGLIDSAQLERHCAGKGVLGLCADVLFHVELLRSHWAGLQGKTGLSLDELTQVERSCEELEELAVLSAGAPDLSEVRHNRRCAFALMYSAYDSARRGMFYLRWKFGDAEQKTPSLWRGRGGHGSQRDAHEEAPASALPVAASSLRADMTQEPGVEDSARKSTAR